jgi:hypothetical protein
MMRWLVLCLGVLVLTGTGWLLYCEHSNSVEVPAPTDAELRSSLARAAAWVVANRSSLLQNNNSMLWLMVREAGRLSNDSQLTALAREYQAQSTDHTVSRFFFDSSGIEQMHEATILLSSDWEDYQRLFVYGATCNVPLRSDPDVAALLSPSGCANGHLWFRYPWCRTHQLMGLRFVQRNHCEPDEETARTVKSVQDLIISELKWDFRVCDAYLQRVWTLVESGRRNDVKAIWLRRILNAQRSDGGWDGTDVIVHLPGGRVVCWQSTLSAHMIPMPASNFHTTAQGLYLMALLLDGQTVAGGSGH